MTIFLTHGELNPHVSTEGRLAALKTDNPLPRDTQEAIKRLTNAYRTVVEAVDDNAIAFADRTVAVAFDALLLAIAQDIAYETLTKLERKRAHKAPRALVRAANGGHGRAANNGHGVIAR